MRTTLGFRLIILAAILGALVPAFWGVLAFVYFNAPESARSDMFWRLVYLTCPSWLLPENNLSWLITPIANAVMYAGIAALALGGAAFIRRLAHGRVG